MPHLNLKHVNSKKKTLESTLVSKNWKLLLFFLCEEASATLPLRFQLLVRQYSENLQRLPAFMLNAKVHKSPKITDCTDSSASEKKPGSTRFAKLHKKPQDFWQCLCERREKKWKFLAFDEIQTEHVTSNASCEVQRWMGDDLDSAVNDVTMTRSVNV